MRLLMLFALATLAVIGVIAVLFIGNFRQSQRDSIVLPDAAQSAQPAAQQVVAGPVQLTEHWRAGPLGLSQGKDQTHTAPTAGQIIGAVAPFDPHAFQQGVQPGAAQCGNGLVTAYSGAVRTV